MAIDVTEIRNEGTDLARSQRSTFIGPNPHHWDGGEGDISSQNTVCFDMGDGDISGSLEEYKLRNGNYPDGGEGKV